MATYLLIGVIYIFGMMSWLYLVKDETLTYSDLIQGVVLVLFWPVLVVVQIYAWSFHYNDKVFLKGDKDSEIF